MIRDLAQSGGILGERYGRIPLETRIVISSGEVVTQTLQRDRWPEYRTVGEAVYLAARMERLAKPNGIWVTEDTVTLIRGQADLRRLGNFSLALGSSEKTFFELVGLSGLHAAPILRHHRYPTDMIGRRDQLSAIADRVAAARAGQGATVFVSGEPGIGKSRVVAELLATAHECDCRVLAISAAPPGFCSPNEDLATLVAELSRLSGEMKALPGITAFRTVLGALGLGQDDRIRDLEELLGAETHATSDRYPEEQFRRAISLLCDAVFALSIERPLLAIIEDVHWASTALTGLVEDVALRVGRHPVVLVATSRKAADRNIAGLPTTTCLELGPLTLASSRALLSAILGRKEELVALSELIVQRAMGNPLFLIEHVSALVEGGRLSGTRGNYELQQPIDDVVLPPTIQGILATRIDCLPEIERSMVLSASVIGVSFDIDLLGSLIDMRRADLAAVLNRLEEKGFVEQTRTLPNVEFRFTHALIHETAYGTLLKKQRRAMHARLLGEIKRRPSSLLFGKSDLMAHHAFRSELWPVAYAWNRRAGESAQRKSWNWEAERFLRQSLSALENLPKTKKNQRRWVELIACYVRSLYALGRFEEARAMLDEVESYPGYEAAGEIGCELTSLSVLYHWTKSNLSEAEAAAQTALRLAREQGDLRLCVSSVGRLGTILVSKGDFHRRYDLLMSAARSIPESRARDTFGLMAVGAVAFRAAAARCLAEIGMIEDARDLSYQALEIADDGKHVFSQIYANLSAAYVMIRARYFERSLPFLERGRALCQTSQFWLMGPVVDSFSGVARIMSGSVSDGLMLLDEASDLSEFPSLMIRHLVQRAWLAEGFLSAGVPKVSLAIASSALDTARKKGERPIEAQCVRIVGESRFLLGMGNTADAVAGITQARNLADQMGMKPLVAQCEVSLGRLDRVEGRERDAAIHFDEASRILEECRMKRLSPAERGDAQLVSVEVRDRLF